jgi:uncharacterized protein YggE
MNCSISKSIYIVGATAIFLCGVLAFSGWRTAPKSFRVVAVAGECNTTAEKDRMSIIIRVQSLNKSPSISMNVAREKMDRVAAAISRISDDKMELQTLRFDSYEKTEWSNSQHKSITLGIETVIELEVSTPNKSTIESVWLYLPEDDGITARNLRMYSSPETIRNATESCLADAVKNAREKAEAIASADNLKVGRMISAGYGSGASNFSPRPLMKAAVNMMSESAGGGIFVRDSEISVSVSAAFEMTR